eukprot:scaffold1516_cov122-Cylindrotheca_fusiformis.AAC.1
MVAFTRAMTLEEMLAQTYEFGIAFASSFRFLFLPSRGASWLQDGLAFAKIFCSKATRGDSGRLAAA